VHPGDNLSQGWLIILRIGVVNYHENLVSKLVIYLENLQETNLLVVAISMTVVWDCFAEFILSVA